MQQFLIGLAIVVLALVVLAVFDRLIFGRWRILEITGYGVGLASGLEEVALGLLLFALLFVVSRHLIRPTLVVYDYAAAWLRQKLSRNRSAPDLTVK